MEPDNEKMRGKHKKESFLLVTFLSLVVFSLLAAHVTHAFTSPTQSPPNGNPGPIPVTDGGTGASTAAGALSNLGAAEAGANTSITSLTPYTGNPLSIGSAGLKFSNGSIQTTAPQNSQWTNSGNGIYYGNQVDTVGIETNSYYGALTVYGTEALSEAGITQILLNTSGAGWGDIQNDGNGIWSLGYSGSSSGTSTPLGTPILSWTRGGQVGIGTTAPTSSLEITYNTGIGTEGDLLRLNAVSGNTGNGPGILFTNNSDVLRLARIAGLDSGNWGGGLAFYTSPGTGSSPGGTPTERMFINDLGQVSVNTTDANFGGKVSSIFSINANSTDGTGLTIGYNGTPSFAVNPNSDGTWTIFDHKSGSWAQDMYANNGSVDFYGNVIANGGPSYAIYNNYPSGYPPANLWSWGLGSAGTIYLEPAAGDNINLTDSWNATGGLNITMGRTNFYGSNGGPINAWIDKSGLAYFGGGIQSLNGNNIGDITGGVGIGNVSTGWYSDPNNLAARFPGGSGDFYVQNSGGGTTYMESGAGVNGTVFDGNVEIGGVTKSAWPGSLAARQGFSSGSGSNFQSQYVTITSISFSLPNTATLSISAFVEDAYSTSYISAYYTNGSSCTSETTSGGNWPMDIGIELDGSTYAWASASGGSYTVNSSDIIPNVASGNHTLSLVSYDSSAPPNLTGCTAAPDAWGTGALSYVAL